uniref:Putative secreted protein n=1 Tax=Amblyomma cajennense TaxID=34607 RepID=A0A023FBJ3_AMBCJ
MHQTIKGKLFTPTFVALYCATSVSARCFLLLASYMLNRRSISTAWMERSPNRCLLEENSNRQKEITQVPK